MPTEQDLLARIEQKLDAHIEQYAADRLADQPMRQFFADITGWRKITLAIGMVIAGILGAGFSLVEIIRFFQGK